MIQTATAISESKKKQQQRGVLWWDQQKQKLANNMPGSLSRFLKKWKKRGANAGSVSAPSAAVAVESSRWVSDLSPAPLEIFLKKENLWVSQKQQKTQKA